MSHKPKTIFGTTEKSNFILNMKKDTVARLVCLVLCAVPLLPLIFEAVTTVGKSYYFFLSVGLYIVGFASILFYLISLLRADVRLKQNNAFPVAVFLVIWAFASYYVNFLNPYEGLESAARPMGLFTPLLGEFGRYEGFLSILAYLGIFFLASVVTSEKTINKIFDCILIAGGVNAVFALLQHIPALNFPNTYKDLPTYAYKNVFISSGLTDSPIFFGGLLTLVGGVALGGCVFGNFSARRQLLYGLAGLLFFTVGLFTSSITPLIGFGAILVILFVISLIISIKGNKTPLKIWGILTILILVIFGIVLLAQGLWIRDVYIARYDGYYLKMIVGANSSADMRSLYEAAWGDSIELIKEYPFFGVGPDSFAAVQNMKTLTFDKSYNDFLFIAVTRGLPSLIAYIVLLVISFIKNIKSMNSNINKPQFVIFAVIFTAALAYIIQSFFNASAVTVAPIFWLILGLSFCKLKRE
ncbi:MAG: O-antigen ligase family protein [Ruminococcus sp.]|jgi:putative inorganic carbon (HCO3(-)) transporter|nr:O-antigen ligase family protein [Ruminococcus sp.]